MTDHAPILTVTLNPALDLATKADSIRPEVKLRCDAPRVDPGGGGLNVSRVIAQLGGRTVAAVSLGGSTGQRLAEALDAAAMEVLVLPAPGETRQSLAVTDRETGLQYRFVMPGPAWSEAAVAEATALIVAAAGEGTRVVLSGSQPPGVPADLAMRLAPGLAAQGARLCVDTSGPALHAIGAAQAGLALLRMDEVEAEDLAGEALPTRASSAAFARSLVARGVAEAVLVARGGDGNILATPDGAWHAEALRVPIVSKVGAGDSFFGAFVLARARGASWPEAHAWGAAAATATCMMPATALGRLEDVERLVSIGCVTPLG